MYLSRENQHLRRMLVRLAQFGERAERDPREIPREELEPCFYMCNHQLRGPALRHRDDVFDTEADMTLSSAQKMILMIYNYICIDYAHTIGTLDKDVPETYLNPSDFKSNKHVSCRIKNLTYLPNFKMSNRVTGFHVFKSVVPPNRIRNRTSFPNRDKVD